ncbi:hypothetical protein ACQKQD_06960 [Methylobacterium sp. NPDC080182]|uniref:5'-methylthioadenosine/S-adenosylhomocysteine nucleosidase family protein n=1 Tax=Methylobacterium sp. NPDC080182 TaxID=3390590 RepID=UPI003D03EBC9
MKDDFSASVSAWLRDMEMEETQLLFGSRIWLGCEGDHGTEVGKAASEVFKSLGAVVACSCDCMDPFEEDAAKERLHASETVVMFASTIDMAARSLEFCHEVGPASSSLTERLFVTIPQKHETGFIKRRIERHGAKVFVYDAPDVSNGKICAHMVSRAYSLRKQAERVTREMEESFSPTLGIVVALEVEFRAAQAILKDPGRPIRKRDANGFREYLPGYIDAYGGGRHKVVLIMVGMGNNKATAQAMRLLQDFKSVQELIMVGIAGGVPGLKAGQKDVRLGDVVVTDETGIAQSDMGKVTDAGFQHRPPPRAASQAWSTLSKGLLAAQAPLQDYWGYVDEICAATDCERPKKDVLRDGVGDEAAVATRRITDKRRAKGRPFAHNGRIGSGNAVIKSAEERERLRDELDIIAIEMEGSGIAEAAWQSERGYIVVRGICDYANGGKEKSWQPYASAVAAAFVRHMVESMPLNGDTTETR